jgi:hypothetical protein
MFGQYSGTACPREPVRSDPAGNEPACLPTTSSDLVRIARGPGGSANVNVRIVFGQGNTCQIDGDAEWRDGAFILRAEGLEAAAPCELAVRIRGAVATLDDEGSRCQPVYCGVRGMFSGARFVKRR